MKTDSHKPLCTTCANAWLAPQGYVKGCSLYLNESTPLQLYGRCVEASASDKCEDYRPKAMTRKPDCR